jgi:ketol-acid reductoisomerase
MQVYHDVDADLRLLEGRQIALIGYGNQGRAQAMNLRDSGLNVRIGNREDGYAERAREDGFLVLAIDQASASADVVMMLIPDEAAPSVFETQIALHLTEGKVLVFASGYNVAFGFISSPPGVDVVLVAPRMIGAGVRDLYVAGEGFPSFIGVAQDDSGQARELALALAKGIGSTRAGVVEVTFAQEAELDLFTEQCFGPAFGHVLTTSVDLLLEEGYPPEAVLLELYMSGEFAYTLGKMAEMGVVEQSALHSPTSQYGSMSRGMRFMLPELRTRMREGLEEIRSGQFAQEWAAEYAAGAPALEALKAAARSLPLHKLEQELRQALKYGSSSVQEYLRQTPSTDQEPTSAQQVQSTSPAMGKGLLDRGLTGLRRVIGRPGDTSEASSAAGPLNASQMENVLRHFLAHAASAPALKAFSEGREMTTHYLLGDLELEFYMCFDDGEVTAALGPPISPAEVRLQTESEVLDGMFTGRINAMRAFMTGKLSFSGEAKLAITIQQIQDDLCQLYTQAREAVAQE